MIEDLDRELTGFGKGKKNSRIHAKMSYGNTMCDALICILIYMLFASIFSKYGPTKAGEQHFYFFF